MALIPTKCDACKAAGYADEYHTYRCGECDRYVCRECSVDRDDESATCLCNACNVVNLQAQSLAWALGKIRQAVAKGRS